MGGRCFGQKPDQWQELRPERQGTIRPVVLLSCFHHNDDYNDNDYHDNYPGPNRYHYHYNHNHHHHPCGSHHYNHVGGSSYHHDHYHASGGSYHYNDDN